MLYDGFFAKQYELNTNKSRTDTTMQWGVVRCNAVGGDAMQYGGGTYGGGRERQDGGDGEWIWLRDELIWINRN